MEQSMGTKKPSGVSKNVIIIAVAAIVIVVAVCATVMFTALNGKEDAPSGPAIGYETDATVMLDEDTLQAAVDEALANAANSMVALEYKNNAYSTDGKTFSCHIVNAASNLYDMFLTIYSDTDMTDQVFLSGLVPPGSGFEEITLDHELAEGDHTVCVAVTQVDTEEDGTQVIKNQVMHTMEFHVTKG